jgi:DNA modification methylase
VERRPLAELIAYARNARTHSEGQVAQIAKSITEFGFATPVLIDPDGTIIAGHGRVLAAGRLGLTTVPVMVADGWSAAQIKAYRIADNQLALNAGWDLSLLRGEFMDLQASGFDLEFTGFAAAAAEAMIADTGGRTEPDDVPEPPEVPRTRPGDVWQLGRHRLICGDATDPEAVQRVLAGATPQLLVTDPPYGVAYDGKWRDKGPRQAPGKSKVAYVPGDGQSDWSAAWAHYQGDVAYIWSSPLKLEVPQHLLAAGFEIRSQIVWRKHQPIFGRGHYHWQHECCWYAVRKGSTGHWQGDRKQSTVWDITTASGFHAGVVEAATTHGTQKPVECMRKPMENNSAVGDWVYDPFLGSGTSVIAAQMAGRCCAAIELNPAYCDQAITRWQEFVGAEAVLEATGEKFDAVRVVPELALGR